MFAFPHFVFGCANSSLQGVEAITCWVHWHPVSHHYTTAKLITVQIKGVHFTQLFFISNLVICYHKKKRLVRLSYLKGDKKYKQAENTAMQKKHNTSCRDNPKH